MLRQNPYMLLIGALNFSAIDLAANRRGQLSTNQRHEIVGRRLHEIEVWVLVLLLLIVSGVALHVRLVVIAFGGATLITLALAIWLKFDADLNEKVKVAQGKPRITQQLRLPFKARYVLVIGDERFTISQRVRRAFHEDARYRVYYSPGSRSLLSAEVT